MAATALINARNRPSPLMPTETPKTAAGIRPDRRAPGCGYKKINVGPNDPERAGTVVLGASNRKFATPDGIDQGGLAYTCAVLRFELALPDGRIRFNRLGGRHQAF